MDCPGDTTVAVTERMNAQQVERAGGVDEIVFEFEPCAAIISEAEQEPVQDQSNAQRSVVGAVVEVVESGARPSATITPSIAEDVVVDSIWACWQTPRTHWPSRSPTKLIARDPG